MKRNYSLLDVKRNAQSILAHDARFFIFGEAHDQIEDRKVFSALISSMRERGVKVIGIEVASPRYNDFFADLQSKIRMEHLSIQEIDGRLNDKFREMGVVLPEAQVTPQLAEIFRNATRNSIRIVGIDPRHENTEYMTRLNSGKDGPSGGLRVVDLLGHDGEAAANAAKELAREVPHSRMAILYGDMHADPTGVVNVDRPPVLAEELSRFGIVSAGSLIIPGSRAPIRVKNYRVMQQDLPHPKQEQPETPAQLKEDMIEIRKEIAKLKSNPADIHVVPKSKPLGSESVRL